MAQKSSTFITETRERETWVRPTFEREGQGETEAEQALAAAALTRGVLQSIPVPEEAEERARALAVQQLQQQLVERSTQRAPQAPWYLRLGRVMRFVFTLGRRR